MYLNHVDAQGGGPPMLTDDPGTLNAGKWEINTSVNSEITKEVQLSVPYIDANYGLKNNLQLKVEVPYLVTIDEQKHVSGALAAPLFGVKYRFMNEAKKFLSITTYPQITFTGNQKEILLPFLFAKTIGRFVIGEEIGYMFIEKDSNIMYPKKGTGS
jgi:hypothetical protein